MKQDRRDEARGLPAERSVLHITLTRADCNTVRLCLMTVVDCPRIALSLALCGQWDHGR